LLETTLPPICCNVRPYMPPPTTTAPPTTTTAPPISFLELAMAHMNKDKQICCPPSALCPPVAGMGCYLNALTACASCACPGIMQNPTPVPPFG
jgi:hypothetical protein